MQNMDNTVNRTKAQAVNTQLCQIVENAYIWVKLKLSSKFSTK